MMFPLHGIKILFLMITMTNNEQKLTDIERAELLILREKLKMLETRIKELESAINNVNEDRHELFRQWYYEPLPENDEDVDD
jgi:hypothetical protein